MIVGIDPGIHGAVAVYVEEVDVLLGYPLPIVTHIVNKKKRQKIDARALFALMRFIVDFGASRVILEEPTALPRQGVTSMFAFGKGCGVIEGVLAALDCEVTRVHPSVWKRTLRVPADKDKSRLRAKQLFPTHAAMFNKPKDEGVAEAAMIAYWGSTMAFKATR